ncbi:hypothetical protein Nepgr_018882 [Nepenthes gracilis]|uniref:Uncharacterized protein n=1 Tax=Nepenthes gracilis TaxID=150966 RepID=A0AAD3XUR8_NEPGR|nr:hypothetical protein Nepgr_018882 [Nepenthes gracilis]
MREVVLHLKISRKARRHAIPATSGAHLTSCMHRRGSVTRCSTQHYLGHGEPASKPTSGRYIPICHLAVDIVCSTSHTASICEANPAKNHIGQRPFRSETTSVPFEQWRQTRRLHSIHRPPILHQPSRNTTSHGITATLPKWRPLRRPLYPPFGISGP